MDCLRNASRSAGAAPNYAQCCPPQTELVPSLDKLTRLNGLFGHVPIKRFETVVMPNQDVATVAISIPAHYAYNPVKRSIYRIAGFQIEIGAGMPASPAEPEIRGHLSLLSVGADQ